MRNVMIRLAAVLSLSAGASVFAQEIYRSTMPDGSVRYGESPEYGAKRVKKMPAVPISTGTTIVSPAEKNRRFAPQPGGTVVMSPPRREIPPPHEQGLLQTKPTSLPTRSSY